MHACHTRTWLQVEAGRRTVTTRVEVGSVVACRAIMVSFPQHVTRNSMTSTWE